MYLFHRNLNATEFVQLFLPLPSFTKQSRNGVTIRPRNQRSGLQKCMPYLSETITGLHYIKNNFVIAAEIFVLVSSFKIRRITRPHEKINMHIIGEFNLFFKT